MAANTCDDVIARPTVLDPGQSVNCSVTMTYTDRTVGQVIDDTVTVVGLDAAGAPFSSQSSASVDVVSKRQVMIVDKQNVQTSIIAPGGVADYNLVITNGPNAVEPIMIMTIDDQMYVDPLGLPPTFRTFGPALDVVNGGGAVMATTCGALINQVLAPNASASCAMTIDTTRLGPLAAGDALRNQIIATAQSTSGVVISGQDIADRAVLLTAPLLDVWKTDGRGTVIEPSSQVTYAIWIDNRGLVGTNPWLRIDKIVDDVHFRAANTDPIGPTVGTVTIDATGVTASFARDGMSLVDTTCAPLIGRLLQPATGLSPYPGFGQDAPRLRPTNADARSECTITLQLPADAGNQYDDTVGVDTTDPGESLVRATNGANTPAIGVSPVLGLVKTANPISVYEPGGDVTFTFEVTNLSVGSDPVTITRLGDDIFGDLFDPTRTDSNCRAVLFNVVMQPGSTLACTLTRRVSGSVGQEHVNTAVVTGVDNDGAIVTATDDARVAILDALPAIIVTKMAIAPEPLPVTVPELGADVTFQIDVTNTSAEVVTLTSLIDSVFGDLDGQGTCAVGETIEPGATYTCTFTGFVRQSGSEPAHVNVVTAHATDNENNDLTGRDDETIPFDRTPPAVEITKTDNGATTVEPGGPVSYTITFGNPATAPEDLVHITALTDTIHYRDRAEPLVVDLLGPLPADLVDNGCPAAVAAALPIVPGEQVACTFTVRLVGTAQTVVDTVTIIALDNDEQVATTTGDEVTPIVDVAPR